MRHKFQSTFKDGNGRVVGTATTSDGVAGTISVYLAGTTTVASVYTASSGGTAVNSMTTDTHGYFYFWVDPKDYGTAQLFKIILSHSDFESKTYDNLKIFPDEVSRFIVDSTEADQGAAGNGFSVKDLVDSIGSNSGTIVFAHNSNSATTTYTFSTSETIPSNINVIIEKGAILSIAAAQTLIINGPFNVGPYQVFSGAGTVTFGGNIRAIQAVWWYDGTDIGAAANSAFASGAKTVLLPSGTLPLLTQISCGCEDNLIGAGMFNTILEKGADIVGIEVTSDYGSLQDFTVDGDVGGGSGDTKDGILYTIANRTYTNNVNVIDCGDNGFNFVKGNLAVFGFIRAASNGGHGFYCDGVDGDTNSGKISFLESTGNTGDGLNMGQPWAESWAITAFCQSNGGKGAFLDSTNGDYVIYSESNTGTETELGANSLGCRLKALLSSVVDNGSYNIIFADLNTKGTQGIYKVRIKELTIADGVTAGPMVFEQTGARAAHIEGSGTGTAMLTLEHTSDPTHKANLDVKGRLSAEFLLGDYFTPTLTLGTGTATLALSANQLYYLVIGKLCFIQGKININAVSTPSGTVVLNGLPFTSASLTEQADHTLINVAFVGLTGVLSGTPMGIISSGVTTMSLIDKVWDSTEYTGDWGDHLNADCWISISGSYVIN